MKTIGYFIPAFPTLSETFILREYLMLKRLGAPLAPASYQPALEAQVQPRAAGAAREFYYLRHQAPLRTALRGAWRRLAQPRALAGVPPKLQGQVGDLAAYWRARRVGHVHIQFGNAAADVPLHAARALGVPASLTLHAQDIFLSPAAELQRRLESVRFATTCTQFNVAHLQRLAPAARIELLPYGLEAADGGLPLFVFDEPAGPGLAREEKLVLSAGRLVANKGVDTLLRALAELPDEVRAVIVGDGPERAALARLAAELGLGARAVFTGALPLPAIRDWYRRATVFAAPCRVLPDTDSDGFPNVLIEAMASGVPVVSTVIRGFGEFISDGQNGMLIPPDDHAALAQAVAGLLADRARREKIAAAAGETVRKNFNLKINTERLLSWIEAGA